MKDQVKAVAELKETFAKVTEKYEATTDDLVKIIGYALDEFRYPTHSTETLTAKGQAELDAKQAKQDKKEATADAKSHK